MRFKSYYHYFNNAIPKKICDDIIKTAALTKLQDGIFNGTGPKQLNLLSINQVNIIIGIMIVFLNLIKTMIMIGTTLEKLENYQ